MIDMTSDDISRTYGDTFIGIRSDEGNNIYPAYVHGSTGRNVLNLQVYKTGSPEQLDININNPSVVLLYPDSGAYNISKNRAAFITRKAQRQWRRGITQRHLNILGDVAFDYKVVRGMFNPKYMSYQQALDVVSSDSLASAAIDRHFWLRSRTIYTNPVIYFRNRIVGEIKDGVPTIQTPVISNLFQEAIRENK